MVEKYVLVNFPPFSTHLFLLCKVNVLFLLCVKLTDCFFILQKKRFCLHFAKLKDYFFSAQNEHTISSLCKYNRLLLLSTKLTHYFFTLQKEQIAFYLCNMNRLFLYYRSEDVPFLQCQFNRLFLCCRKWRDWFLYCRKWRHSFSTVPI